MAKKTKLSKLFWSSNKTKNSPAMNMQRYDQNFGCLLGIPLINPSFMALKKFFMFVLLSQKLFIIKKYPTVKLDITNFIFNLANLVSFYDEEGYGYSDNKWLYLVVLQVYSTRFIIAHPLQSGVASNNCLLNMIFFRFWYTIGCDQSDEQKSSDKQSWYGRGDFDGG